LVLSVSMLLALAPNVNFAVAETTSSETALTPFQAELESKYIDPDRVFSTDVRWWLGMASCTDETLLESIQTLYDSGFRGAELCMQSETGADNMTYAYGSEMWAHKWKLMMNKFLDLGMGVYLTSGTHWSTSNVPGLDPDSQAAMQVVMQATSTVDTGAALTSLPAPAVAQRRSPAKFLGAYAYIQTSNNVLDHGSLINLTPLVTQGADVWTQNLNWTAPVGGTWRIFSQWSEGRNQTSSPSTVPAVCINYFDSRGVAAMKDFWEANILDDPELNAKILTGDVQLFMDSMEITVGNGVTYWSEDMAEQFEIRKGYDIRPYLFLMAGITGGHNRNNNLTYNPLIGTTRGTYRFGQTPGVGDELLREKILRDYHDVLTELYMERKLSPLKEWLNSVGIKTRAQVSYGAVFEISEPTMYLDYPETENRVMYNQVDYFRFFSGGAKLQNKVLSSETGAQGNNNYRFPIQYHLRDAYSQFAAGIQRTIWHIWSTEYGYSANTVWPGSTPGDAQYFRFGARHPYARNYDEFNAHLGRVQQLLQTGKARSDIGFIYNTWDLQVPNYGEGASRSAMSISPATPANVSMMNWQLAHMGVHYRSTGLQDNGYTYDYFSPELLFADGVYFNEETKTIEQGGYRALVLMQNFLDFKAAERILEWARKGLPVVILGDAASRTTFNDGKDAELAGLITELKTLPTVKTASVANYDQYFDAQPVGYEDNVLDLLQELGVYPNAEYIEPNHQLLTQSRIDDDGNMYLYAYNYCPDTYHIYSHIDSVKTESHGANIKTEIKMDGMFIPYAIDAWSGKVTQLANYRWDNGRTVFPIDLDYDNIALFAFEAVNSERLHILSTDAESSYATQNALVVRAAESGTYTTSLSNGCICQNTVTVPGAYDITDWNVAVESWTPNPTQRDLSRTETIGSVTTTNYMTSTVKTPISVQLPALTTWNNITGIGQAVSGTGRYEAAFNWRAGAADGAYLDFGGSLIGSMEVWINGKKVDGHISANPTKAKRSVGEPINGEIPAGKDQCVGGVSWTKPIIDIGAYLVDGVNEIAIEYSSDLTNIQISRNAVSTGNAIYGFFNYSSAYREYGPSRAVIVPYVELVIPRSTVFADIRADESAVAANAPASYAVSLTNAKGAGVVTLSFTADSRYLDLNNATALNGFTILEPLAWEYVGSQLWKGTVKLYCPGFVQSDDPLDVLRVGGVARGFLGDTTVTLTDISVTGDVDGFSGARLALIKTAEAAASIVPAYSKYDLNHDGRIDEFDLAIVVFYYLANDLDADWDVVKFDIASAKDCDVAHNGRVDLADMIEVIANYTDSY